MTRKSGKLAAIACMVWGVAGVVSGSKIAFAISIVFGILYLVVTVRANAREK